MTHGSVVPVNARFRTVKGFPSILLGIERKKKKMIRDRMTQCENQKRIVTKKGDDQKRMA